MITRRLWKFLALCALAGLPIDPARALDRDMLRFAAEKEAQVRTFARSLTNKVPSIVWSFFDAVRVDDWETATNLAGRINQASGRFGPSRTEAFSPALRSMIWPPISETVGAYESFHNWDSKWLHRFGHDIIESIPRGSIYFGGTDPGRFIISALSDSQIEGRPFFTLTQNQLVDRTYLEYLQVIYGGRLYVPTSNDLQLAFTEYRRDAADRLRAGRLKPGENVQITPDGRVQVSGEVAVMEINALLVKIVLDKNPGREFFIEESFPLDWMFPHLSPHGLILQLHSRPLTELRAADAQKDHDYWKKFTGELLGDWLDDETSVRDICEFSEKIHLRKDLAGFKGDAAFVRNDAAQKTFSKLRGAIAGVYLWRADHAKDDDETVRMRRAADFAWRQAIALCPTLPEAVFRYSRFLQDLKRHDEAILVAETCLRLDPDDATVRELVRSLRQAE